MITRLQMLSSKNNDRQIQSGEKIVSIKDDCLSETRSVTEDFDGIERDGHNFPSNRIGNKSPMEEDAK